MTEVVLGGVALHLLAERAVWLPALGTLVVADVHVGKAEAFRSAGVPVPLGELDATLRRLRALVEATGARRVVVAGDWIHARSGLSARVVEGVAELLESSAAEFVLVPGNHDGAARTLPARWPLRIAPSHGLELGGLRVVHDPADVTEGPALAGHLHPMVRVGRAGRGLVLPGFVERGSVLVLPAFTEWSSGVRFGPRDADRRWAIAGHTVRAV